MERREYYSLILSCVKVEPALGVNLNFYKSQANEKIVYSKNVYDYIMVPKRMDLQEIENKT